MPTHRATLLNNPSSDTVLLWTKRSKCSTLTEGYAGNTGIGGNGGWTSILQLKNKAKQQSGVDLILEQNPVNSSFQILKASAAGQTNKAYLPLRQCLNVSRNYRNSTMDGEKLIQIIAADILGASTSVDFVVDKESSSLHFLFGDLLTLTDQRIRRRVLFSGLPPEIIRSTVDRLKLGKGAKSAKSTIGITIVLIDNSICYLLADNEDPDARVNSPLRTTEKDIINNYAQYFSHLWNDSNDITLYEDFSNIIKTDNYAKIIVATDSIYDRLQYDLRKNPNLIHNLESYEFENLVESLLRSQGYDTMLTPKTKDGGKDILAQFKTPDGFNCVCLVECKKYSPERPVGVQWVRALYGVVEQQNANLGMLVTPSRFTKGAYEFRNEIKKKISLKDFKDLESWISKSK